MKEKQNLLVNCHRGQRETVIGWLLPGTMNEKKDTTAVSPTAGGIAGFLFVIFLSVPTRLPP